jgi:integrase
MRSADRATAGRPRTRTGSTVAEFLQRWLDHQRTQVSPQSHATYTNIVGNLTLVLGAVKLAKVSPEGIAKAYADALDHGRRDGSGGLSAASIRLMHRVLHKALQQAVVWRLLPGNVASLVKPPRVEPRRMQTHDLLSTTKLIEHVRLTELFGPVLLCGLLGLRRGEAAATRWQYIDLDAGRLSVRATIEQATGKEKLPKSGVARSVALSPMVTEELRKLRLRQAEALLKIGIRQTEDTHVCLRTTGEPWDLRQLTYEFTKAIKQSELSRIRLHDLRHGHATHMLGQNTHVKIVSERLGHASVRTTLDLYMHVLPGMQEEAAANLDVALRAAKEKPKG